MEVLVSGPNVERRNQTNTYLILISKVAKMPEVELMARVYFPNLFINLSIELKSSDTEKATGAI